MSDWTRPERLVLDCVQRTPSRAALARIRESAAGPLDWEQVVRIAEEQAVWASLLETAKRLSLDVPAMLRDDLQQRLVATTAQNLARTSQLARILALLRTKGVTAIAFKGPSLSAYASDHLGGRSSVDLDLLVSPGAAQRVCAIMLACGYSLADSGADGLDGVYPAARREAVFLPPPGDPAPIEVQVTVSTWSLAIRLDTDGLIDRAITVCVAGVPVTTLCPEDLLLTLAIHGIRHVWAHVRLIADIDAVAYANPDWAVVIERARAARITRILWVALLLAHDVLETPVPERVLDLARDDGPAVRLARQIAARLFDPPAERPSRLWELWVHLRSREHISDQVRCGLRLLMWKHVIWPWDRWHARRRASRTLETRAAVPGGSSN